MNLDRFADFTDIHPTEEIVSSFWLLDDGSVYEERQCRRSTRILLKRIHHHNSEVAWDISARV